MGMFLSAAHGCFISKRNNHIMKLNGVHISENGLMTVPVSSDSSESKSLYKIVRAIFREIAMALQYTLVLISCTIYHLPFLPSSLGRTLKVSSRNIAGLNALGHCLATAWHPLPRTLYNDIGRTRGLRVTHDITYQPASGLCLAMSLIFLSKYLLGEEANDTTNLLAAAEVLRTDEKVTSVKLQGIYDALLGINGAIKAEEKDFFCAVLQGRTLVFQLDWKYELLVSIEAFMAVQNHLGTLRQFIFDDLENRNVEITPDIYALTLELDAFWNLQQYPAGKKFDSIHHAIIQTLADELELEMTNATRLQGMVADVEEKLINLALGSYLVQFPNHTIVLVKTKDHLALFDPNEGLGLSPVGQQHEAVAQFLDYYASVDLVSLNVISIEPKAKNE